MAKILATDHNAPYCTVADLEMEPLCLSPILKHK
ncbi:MAG: hypothetical protein ETSY1_39225 [Candidatus Entotheonella factor]|uniref:Uncharacterized protein n=1 Tax=Entotheonella factor TaxID=1429438 RepID=W4L7W7_ENTF1|nr:MAG: hypothetical protein ETSY1_39225 [Candidatus Entotheonella factor]